MPKKPVKWGIKLWCLCDANTGYCLAFSVYTGAEEQTFNLDLGYRVVMRLMRRYLLSYHHLYADNYFTSVHLAVDLRQADTYYLCGTTRATRREFPNSLAAVRLQQGDSVKWVNEDGVMVRKWKDKQGDSVKWVNEDGVMVCKWKDKRDVFMIATNDAGGDVIRPTRRHRQMINLPVPTYLCGLLQCAHGRC